MLPLHLDNNYILRLSSSQNSPVLVTPLIFPARLLASYDGGRSSVYVLLSLVNKETALSLDRTTALTGRVDKTECWEEGK